MHVRVDAALSLDGRELSPKLLERLCYALSFPNPAYRRRLRLGLPTGALPEKLCLVEEQGDAVRLPRGAIHVLRDAAVEEGLLVRCDDQRRLPCERLTGLPAVPLRDYQAAAVEKLAKVTQGMVIVPCGGGKTQLAIGAIARLQTPTLVLVHTLDLAEQWRSQIQGKLGVDAGLVGGGKAHVAPITVAVIQTLTGWTSERLDDWMTRFGLLILDEAHHVVASTFHRIVGRSPARYRLGLTATPEREDGLTPLLGLFLGASLLTVTHAELVAAGVLTVPTVRIVETRFTFDYAGAKDYAPMLAALVQDDARNALLARTVAAEAAAGHVCLVLCGRIAHCEQLAERLTALGVQSYALTSGVAGKRRQELLKQARDGQPLVLIATSLADEGLDLPRLSRVFLAHPARARSRIVQRLGRLMRPHPDKPSAVLVDFVDARVPLLRRYAQERRRLYAELLGQQTHPEQP